MILVHHLLLGALLSSSAIACTHRGHALRGLRQVECVDSRWLVAFLTIVVLGIEPGDAANVPVRRGLSALVQAIDSTWAFGASYLVLLGLLAGESLGIALSP